MFNLKILLMTIFIFIFVAKSESAFIFDQKKDDHDMSTDVVSNYEVSSNKETVQTVGKEVITHKKRTRRYILNKLKWRSCNITYNIVKYSDVLSVRLVEKIMAHAFSQWSSMSGLHIERTTRKADISISFLVRDICDGVGFGGALGHATFPIQNAFIHFDDAIGWDASHEILLLQIALHEIGHTLGLEHSNDMDSIMQYKSELEEDDRLAMMKLYGHCYETELKKPNHVNEIDESACPPEYIDAILQTDENDTFIFKDRHYWELSKDSFTVKPGSYKLISQTWPELNEYVGAAFSFNNLTHFIKGNLLYLYNGSDLLPTYPKDKKKVHPNFKKWWSNNFKFDYLDATFEWENSHKLIPYEDNDKTHASSIRKADAVFRQANKILFFRDQHYNVAEMGNDDLIKDVSGPYPISTIWPDCSQSSSFHRI